MTSFTILGAKLKGRVRLSKTAINPQQEGLIIANIDRRLEAATRLLRALPLMVKVQNLGAVAVVAVCVFLCQVQRSLLLCFPFLAIQYTFTKSFYR